MITKSYSGFMAWNHSGWARACFAVVGSKWNWEAFGLHFSILALVSIGWLLTKRGAWLVCLSNDRERDLDELVLLAKVQGSDPMPCDALKFKLSIDLVDI